MSGILPAVARGVVARSAGISVYLIARLAHRDVTRWLSDAGRRARRWCVVDARVGWPHPVLIPRGVTVTRSIVKDVVTHDHVRHRPRIGSNPDIFT